MSKCSSMHSELKHFVNTYHFGFSRVFDILTLFARSFKTSTFWLKWRLQTAEGVSLIALLVTLAHRWGTLAPLVLIWSVTSWCQQFPLHFILFQAIQSWQQKLGLETDFVGNICSWNCDCFWSNLFPGLRRWVFYSDRVDGRNVGNLSRF